MEALSSVANLRQANTNPYGFAKKVCFSVTYYLDNFAVEKILKDLRKSSSLSPTKKYFWCQDFFSWYRDTPICFLAARFFFYLAKRIFFFVQEKHSCVSKKKLETIKKCFVTTSRKLFLASENSFVRTDTMYVGNMFRLHEKTKCINQRFPPPLI